MLFSPKSNFFLPKVEVFKTVMVSALKVEVFGQKSRFAVQKASNRQATTIVDENPSN